MLLRLSAFIQPVNKFSTVMVPQISSPCWKDLPLDIIISQLVKKLRI
jgi:hypothetical protein